MCQTLVELMQALMKHEHKEPAKGSIVEETSPHMAKPKEEVFMKEEETVLDMEKVPIVESPHVTGEAIFFFIEEKNKIEEKVRLL